MVYNKMRVVITANGKGERMKYLSPLPKHELYFGDKKIIDHLKEVFPGAEVLTGFESNSRRETLERIRDYTDCLIVDCDIIPKTGFKYVSAIYDNGSVLVFDSDKEKYSSVQVPLNFIIKASENKSISNTKCSGMYFVKSVDLLLKNMTDDNSIVSGMIGSGITRETDIIKLGDPSDYYEALGIKDGSFTGNRVEFNKNTVIKYCATGRDEAHWYQQASNVFSVPAVKYSDSEMIITERIYPTTKPTAEDFIRVIGMMRQTGGQGNGRDFQTYLDNLPGYEKPIKLVSHPGTFFHGDLSTHNVLKNSRVWLIDPNYREIFGSWLTDAGKAVFSFIAYEQNYPEAKKIADHFGPNVWAFAVAEGLRVTKYKPEYISIVNNIYEIYLIYGNA